MKLLREYIRALLTEAAKGPSDLPEGVYIAIHDKGVRTKVYYAFEDGTRRKDVGEPQGSVFFSPRAGQRTCLGANEVMGATATHGWGPLLYDVAMEISGDKGLMADRHTLSDEAYNVWRIYMSRDDVQKKQLDDLNNTLTPQEEDNCEASSVRYRDRFGDYIVDDKKKAIKDSPVMKVYTKGPTTIQQLEKMERVIRV